MPFRRPALVFSLQVITAPARGAENEAKAKTPRATLTAGRAICIVVSVLAGHALEAQQFRVDSRLILVPVTVTDGRGANITGLRQDSFTLLDNGQTQPITAFFMEDAPCTVGLVVDTSGSVRNSITWEKAVVRAFLELSNPDDDYFAATISSAPAMLAPVGTEVETIDDRVRMLTAGGWTALYDTIADAARRAGRSKRSCKALLVISDGIDNHSRISRNELIRYLMEADVQVYTIAIENVHPVRKGIELSEDQRGRAFMNDVALKTGGMCAEARDTDKPSRAAATVSAALRNRYVLGFRSPGDDGSAKWHQIQVKVDKSRARVYARGGYRVPATLP
jgi:Ca-activated chloride channel family protein